MVGVDVGDGVGRNVGGVENVGINVGDGVGTAVGDVGTNEGIGVGANVSKSPTITRANLCVSLYESPFD